MIYLRIKTAMGLKYGFHQVVQEIILWVGIVDAYGAGRACGIFFRQMAQRSYDLLIVRLAEREGFGS